MKRYIIVALVALGLSLGLAVKAEAYSGQMTFSELNGVTLNELQKGACPATCPNVEDDCVCTGNQYKTDADASYDYKWVRYLGPYDSLLGDNRTGIVKYRSSKGLAVWKARKSWWCQGSDVQPGDGSGACQIYLDN